MAGYPYDVPLSGDFSVPGLWPDQPTILVFGEVQAGGFDEQFPVGVYDGTANLNIDQSAAVQIDLSGGDVTGLALVASLPPSVQGHISGQNGITPHGWVTLCGDGGCASSDIHADGSYAFWNLPSGTYTMQVSSFDHVGGYVTAGGGVSANSADAAAITVSSSDLVRNVTLPEGFTISGRLTGPNDEPVVDGFASASSVDGGFANSAQTDANGDYVIRGLRAGDYRVRAGGPDTADYFSGYWSPTGYTTDFEAAGIVHIASPAPTIVSTSPANGATNVSRDGRITVTFSAGVSHVTRATIRLHALGSATVLGGKVTYDGATHTATLRPDKLKPLTTYVLEIDGVTGTDGTPVEPVSISFTTGRK
jgi:hypothetical protein